MIDGEICNRSWQKCLCDVRASSCPRCGWRLEKCWKACPRKLVFHQNECESSQKFGRVVKIPAFVKKRIRQCTQTTMVCKKNSTELLLLAFQTCIISHNLAREGFVLFDLSLFPFDIWICLYKCSMQMAGYYSRQTFMLICFFFLGEGWHFLTCNLY